MPARHTSVYCTLGLAMLAIVGTPLLRAAGDKAAHPPVVLLTSQQDLSGVKNVVLVHVSQPQAVASIVTKAAHGVAQVLNPFDRPSASWKLARRARRRESRPQPRSLAIPTTAFASIRR
jgi:hypothetical protein